MTYRAAAALQEAIFLRLQGHEPLTGVTVADAVPVGTVPESYVLIGPEVVRDQSDISGAGAEHRLDVSVISTASGFLDAKTIAGEVCVALVDAPLELAAGHLVSLGFQRAAARRLEDGGMRRIDLTFRGRVAF